jgi:hypothetical protein
MSHLAAVRIGLVLLASFASVTACSTVSCGANGQKLSRLAPGMAYEEVAGVLGCSGRLVRGSLDSPDEYATVEWDGPDSLLFTRTDMIFLDRRLLSFSIQPRGAD